MKKKNKKKGEKFVCARNIGPVDHAGYGNDEREGNEKKRKNVKRRDRNKIKMCLERSIVGEGETQN